MYPVFCGAIPQGEYTISFDRDGTLYTGTVDLTDGYYYCAPPEELSADDDDVRDQFDDFVTGSVWPKVLEALDDAEDSGNNTLGANIEWQLTCVVDRDVAGYKYSLRLNNGLNPPFGPLLSFTLDESESTFDFRWLGYNNADITSNLANIAPTDRVPMYTWAPWSHMVCRGERPMRQQVAFSGPTAGGRVYAVRQDDGTIRRWRHVLLDGSMAGGVDGARMQEYKLGSRLSGWRDQIGVSTTARLNSPWVAFDAEHGWWDRTLDGVPFVVVDNMYEPGEADRGEYIISTLDLGGAPCAMTGWDTAGPPNVRYSAAGRRLLEFCMLAYQG